LLLAQILEIIVEPVAHLVPNDPADADPARLGQRFKPRRDIHPVAEDIVLFGDHIAEVDPDPESDALVLGRRCVAVSHPSLHFDTAADGVHNTCKFRQEAVAGVLYDAAPVFGDFGVDQFPEVRFQPFVCPLLIPATSAARIAVRRRTGGHGVSGGKRA